MEFFRYSGWVNYRWGEICMQQVVAPRMGTHLLFFGPHLLPFL